MKIDLLHADLTRRVLGSAIDVHRQLGPGLLESAYRICLRDELTSQGFSLREEVPIPIRYKNVRMLRSGIRRLVV